MSNASINMRRLSDVAVVPAALVVRNVAKATAQAAAKAPVNDRLVTNTMLAGSASVLAGTFDMVQLIRNPSGKGHEQVTQGIGSGLQVVGGLIMMSKTNNRDVKMAGAAIAVGGTVAKAVDRYIPSDKSRYLNYALKGAVAGVTASTLLQTFDSRMSLTSGNGMFFNPRALAVTATVGAVVGTIVAAAE
jgi:hypothetical protein